MYVPSTNVYGTQQATTEADDRTPPKDQTSFPKDMMPYCVCIYEWDATFVKAGLKPSNVDLFTRICTIEFYRKSIIQHCERSELRLQFEWTKVN